MSFRRGTPQMHTDAYTRTQYIKREKLSKWFCKTKLAFYILTCEQSNPPELGVGCCTSWKGFTPSGFPRITPTTTSSHTYVISAGTTEGFVQRRYLDVSWAAPPSAPLLLQGHKLTTTPIFFLAGYHDLCLLPFWTPGFAFVINVWENTCVFSWACSDTWRGSVRD